MHSVRNFQPRVHCCVCAMSQHHRWKTLPRVQRKFHGREEVADLLHLQSEGISRLPINGVAADKTHIERTDQCISVHKHSAPDQTVHTSCNASVARSHLMLERAPPIKKSRTGRPAGFNWIEFLRTLEESPEIVVPSAEISSWKFFLWLLSPSKAHTSAAQHLSCPNP